MAPQFARNPTDAMQCYAEFLDVAHLNRSDPVHDLELSMACAWTLARAR